MIKKIYVHMRICVINLSFTDINHVYICKPFTNLSCDFIAPLRFRRKLFYSNKFTKYYYNLIRHYTNFCIIVNVKDLFHRMCVCALFIVL